MKLYYFIPVFLLSMFLTMSHAQLQGPAPGKSKSGNKQQHQTTTSYNVSGPAQITILGETKITPHDNQQKTNNKTSSNWWIVIFTACLVGVGIFQLFMFRRQLNLMRQGVQDASIAANAAKEAAEATKQTLTLTFRPRLRVRNIRLHPLEPIEGNMIRGYFRVSNIGGSQARVTASYCEPLWKILGLPMESPYEGKGGNYAIATGTVIALGGSCEGIFPGLGSEPITYRGLEEERYLGQLRLYVMGWIEYEDEIGTHRRTAFCQRYLIRNGVGRFYSVKEEPDYEYEE